MSKIIVAIGGGENGRILEDGSYSLYETEKIDREIIKLTNKDKPNYLFINHAMPLEIQESYFTTMKNIYGKKFNLECRMLKSTELEDNEKVNELMEWADIIYEGGGDTSLMIDLWKKTGFYKKLYESWNKGKVICGISAGAVCYFNSCNSDYIIDNNVHFEVVKCLNWINLFITPHCNEIGRKESSKLQLMDSNLVGIMLSNCSALEIIDDKYRIITSSNDGYAYKTYWYNNKYYEEKLQLNGEVESLNNLIKRG